MNNFISSPVLREFYNTALKKGWVKEEIEKTASSDVVPSGDLDIDILSLINNLNKRGLKSEASSLEQKFILFKQAQFEANHLIDSESRALLDLAHAGNTKIVDTQSGLGEIHTNLDRQRKIIETLNHQPGQNLISSAAEALGLVKKSQVNLEEEKISLEDQVTDVDQEEWEMSVSEEDKKKVETINLVIKTNSQALQTLLLQITNFITNSKSNADYFNQDVLSKDSNLLKYYGEVNGLSDLSSFIKMLSFWGLSVESITNKIVSFNSYKASYSGLYNYVPKNIFSTYFYGTKLTDFAWQKQDMEQQAIKNEIRKGNHEFINNDNSIWEGNLGSAQGNLGNLGNIKLTDPSTWGQEKDLNIKMDSYKLRMDKAEEAANAIFTWLSEEKEKYFNEGLAKNAALNIFSEVDKTVGVLIGKAVPIVQNIPAVRRTTGLVKDQLFKVNPLLLEASSNIEKTTLFSLINSAATLIKSYLDSGIKITDKMLEYLDQNKLNPTLDTTISKEKIVSWTNKIKLSYQLWNRYLQEYELNEQQINAINNFKSDLKKLYGLLSGLNALTFASFKVKFGDFFGQETLQTPAKLDAYFNSILQNAIQTTGFSTGKSAQLINNIEKNAQLTGPNLGGNPKPKSKSNPNNPVSTGPNVNQNKPTARVDLTESGKAVQRMQLLLRNIASWLVSVDDKNKNSNDVNLLMRIGPETKDPTLFDGVWGPNTNKAVETASKYTEKYLQKKLELGPMIGKTQDEIKNKATTNSNLLATLLQKVNYAGLKDLGISSDGVVYDKIHKGFNITTLEDLNGTIPLKTTDLASLKSLYNFIKQNGIYTGIDEGISLKDWDDALKWLINRAMFKYKSAKNTKEIGIATAYYRNAIDLAYKFYGLAQKFNKSISEDSEIAIHPDDLEGSSGTSGNNFGFMPNGKLDKSKLQLISDTNSPNNSLVSNQQGSSDQKIVSQNPITRDYLFLNSVDPNGNSWFNPSLGYNMPLSRSYFNNNAIVVAQSLFGNLIGDDKYMYNTFLNQNPIFKFLSDSPNGPIVLDSRDQARKYLSNTQEFQNAKLKLQNQLPVMAYQIFLRNLINELTRVFNQWIKITGPVPPTIAQVQEYQQEWLQGINKHLNDLKEFSSGRTLRPSRF